MKSFTALTTLLLAAVASATPTPVDFETSADVLAKRDTEIVYLANCQSEVSCCTPTQYYSQILYYPASADSNNGQAPTAANTCTVNSNSLLTWEGSAQSCTYSSGVTFTSHIDAGSHAAYSYSGWGSNGFKNWNCYRDNGRLIFSQSRPEAENHCNSIYYCLPQ
ncbi:hypothetical protein QBC46DRAFT_325500 [Diplogelasinospora grovesii]|uniref:Small secreted protein n=1 Tax=Diplogelasinospora grovesii TaxID=303347 RepID=A0AAN6RZ69_9PEZI|nr:hypothetical protein QBC46DRAFT_325500 [Diplogelasinospora grovesii]